MLLHIVIHGEVCYQDRKQEKTNPAVNLCIKLSDGDFYWVLHQIVLMTDTRCFYQGSVFWIKVR